MANGYLFTHQTCLFKIIHRIEGNYYIIVFVPVRRYDLNADVSDNGEAQIPVIPTPDDFQVTSDDVVDISEGGWVIAAEGKDASKIGEYLADKLGLPFVEEKPSRRYIELSIGDVQDRSGNQVDNEEAYRNDIKVTNEIIDIVGKSVAGLLHGAHTVLSLYQHSTEMPDVVIVDYPRFPYRGMFVMR
ncbi:putative beta-hexosaminidase [Amphiura filiformis]|uniref:putative beta-hexosaminidase n=1 Tax=Amphiura filiformis TaxID=82378 RepID=UPI003B20D1AD